MRITAEMLTEKRIDGYEKNNFDIGNGSDTDRLRSCAVGGGAARGGKPERKSQRNASRQQQALCDGHRQGQGSGLPRRRERTVHDDGHVCIFSAQVGQAEARAGNNYRRRGGAA